MCGNFAVGSSAGNRILPGVSAAALGMENAGVLALARVVLDSSSNGFLRRCSNSVTTAPFTIDKSLLFPYGISRFPR